MIRAGLFVCFVAALVMPAMARAQSTPGHHVAAPAGHPTPTAPAVAPEGVVNINTASEQELERLPGVGPARATAIISLRGRVQRFHAPDDLLRVRGIGHAGMRRMRPFVTLSGNTTLTARPGHAARATTPGPLAEGGT